jgi:predicted aminopeptidase
MNRTGDNRDAKWRWWLLPLLPAMAAFLSGCQIAYYAQAAKGQLRILRQRERIDRLVADPQTPAPLKRQLQLVEELRQFARYELALPVNGHYQHYADLRRPYVVWNIQAAPEFSLAPKTWWYPLVGRLEYRGYFSEDSARDCAARLAAKGWDVTVDGVEAYSTLGWFKDPVLNTFVHEPEPTLAEIIFHELAHQRVFAPGDTDFNEAFATTVGQEGVRRWLHARGRADLAERYAEALERNTRFVRLVLAVRTQLERIYGDTRDEVGNLQPASRPPAPPDELRRQKQRAFADLRRYYARLKSVREGWSECDDWLSGELNNARLNTIADYYDLVPGFERLLESTGGDLAEFYRAVERLAGMPKEKRDPLLREPRF